MAGTSVSVSTLAETLGVTTESLSTALMTVGQTPRELASHTTKREYIMTGISPSDFTKQHSAMEMDYGQLQLQFKQICMDYGDAISWDTKSLAVEFCSKIIYEVGPESRQVKKTDGGKVWKFKFPYTSRDGKAVVKVAFVATFKTDNATVKPTQEANKIILTVKQASLLAMDTFGKLAEAAFNTNATLLLTPLAGAVFSKTDLINLSKELHMSTNIPGLLNVINSSCQSGGQALPNSRGHCAVVAALIVTKGIKDENVRATLVTKLTKQYFTAGKPIDIAKFKVYAKYAHGGVPAGFDIEYLDRAVKAAQEVKISLRKLAASAKGATIISKIDVPSGSHDDDDDVNHSSTPT